MDDQVQAAIDATLPQAPGQREQRIFEFARHLKAIAALSDADVRALRPVARRWHEGALPVIGTKAWDDTWGAFQRAWERVLYPAGQDVMGQVLEAAKQAPLPPEAAWYDSPDTHLLIRICRELQRRSGDGSFYLSARTAARLLDVERMTAWRRLTMLIGDGLLAVVELGARRGDGRGRAARYRYTCPDAEPAAAA